MRILARRKMHDDQPWRKRLTLGWSVRVGSDAEGIVFIRFGFYEKRVGWSSQPHATNLIQTSRRLPDRPDVTPYVWFNAANII